MPQSIRIFHIGRLKRQAALVTGASWGIGEAIARGMVSAP